MQSTPSTAVRAPLVALERLGNTGIPFDPDVWLHGCALHRAAIKGNAEKAEKYDQHDWPSMFLEVHGDGRVRPTWSASGWTTRIVSKSPYVQGIPKGVMRQAVQRRGSLIVTADWSASHLRLLAHLSDDTRLIADLVSGDPYAEVADHLGLDPIEDRKRVKQGILAALNGEGAKGRMEHLPEAAYRLPMIMRRRWPRAMSFIDALVADARRSGGTLTTPDGTTVSIPDDRFYAAPAGFLQAVEADALRRVLVAVQGLEDAGLPLNLVMLVHDEIVVEATDPARIDLVLSVVEDAMVTALGVRPELHTGAVKVTFGPSWGQQDGSSGPSDLPDLPDGVEIRRPVRRAPWAHLDPDGISVGCVNRAQKRAQEIRKVWRKMGLTTRSKNCSASSIHAESREMGKFVSFALRCKKVGCILCGPYRLALIEEAILSMPLVSADGLVVGRPLGDRTLHLYRFPEAELRSFLIAHRKATRKRIGFRLLDQEASIGGMRSFSEVEADGYVVFHLPMTGEAVVLSTIPKVYQRASKVQPVTVLHNLITVESLVAEALHPIQRHEPFGTWSAAGKVSSSNNLHLDPRALTKRARTSFRRTPSAPSEPPSRLEERIKAMVQAYTTRRDAEGVLASVAVHLDDLKGDRDLYLAVLEKGLSPEQVEERIERFLDSCQVVEIPVDDEQVKRDLEEATKMLEEDITPRISA